MSEQKMSQDVDEVDGNCSSKTCETDDDKTEESPPTYNKYFAFMPADKHSLFYNMNHPYRGHAFIFSHRYSKKKAAKTGVVEDCKDLQECLEYIGFKVHVFKDLMRHKIEHHIEQASKWDHHNCDCFLIVVLSHGEGGTIQAADASYKPEHLWSSFTPDKCPSLAGKPKIFIFESGRGRNIDSGVTLTRRRVQFDHQRVTYKIPLQADFLFCYSTPEGYDTWRDANGRSWFIRALCLELKERAFSDHILAILTFVNQRVAVDYESCYPKEPSKHRAKQIPCFVNTFSRFLKFSPKNVAATSINDSNNNS